MSLRIRFQYPTGSQLGYSIERLSDGMLYDLADGTFKATPATPISSLPEDTGIFAGRFHATLSPTPVSQFTDGDYVVTIHDQHSSNAVVAELAATMHGGDDATIFPVTQPVPKLQNAGFEVPVVGSGQYAGVPPGGPWTGGLVISGNNSPYTSSNPQAPEGVQVCVLQRTSSISQVVNGWAAGNYVILFQGARRVNYGSHDFNVLVDGNVVGTFLMTQGTYAGFFTAPFAVTAGSHTITFAGVNSAGGDNTSFIDNIQIAGF